MPTSRSSHLATLQAALSARGQFAGAEVLAPGEATKSFPVLARLSERLLEMGLERGDLVVALGGGVIGDLAGFAASILRRGTRFVQIPTTLLAQVDSSVGGKTGINTPQGKNLVGAFHQPSLVLADIDTLATLPARQFRAGYAEMAKYGLLGDAAFFAWLEQNSPAVFARDASALTHALAVSVQGKADIVARDETETGDRMLLNLGHTFGHALEAWAGFSDRLLHGEAVAIGICLAFRLSEELGTSATTAWRGSQAHFAALGLPTCIADIPGGQLPDAATLVKIMGQDKKVREGTADADPGARHRRSLHHPRRAARQGAGLPGPRDRRCLNVRVACAIPAGPRVCRMMANPASLCWSCRVTLSAWIRPAQEREACAQPVPLPLMGRG